MPREETKRPKRNKLFYKNRWLISRNVVTHLRRAGVVCDIVVPDGIRVAMDGVLSPGERAALALVAEAERNEAVPLADELESDAPAGEIKRRQQPH